MPRRLFHRLQIGFASSFCQSTSLRPFRALRLGVCPVPSLENALIYQQHLVHTFRYSLVHNSHGAVSDEQPERRHELAIRNMRCNRVKGKNCVPSQATTSRYRELAHFVLSLVSSSMYAYSRRDSRWFWLEIQNYRHPVS